MKSVTEFMNNKLAEGLTTKTALAAEGKSPEEISAAIGEKFKFEGDRLKSFVAALDIAAATTEGKIFRIKVVKLNEGQNPPPKATVVEDLCYITELANNPADLLKKAQDAKAQASEKKDTKGGPRGKGGPGGKGKGGGKPKESPWGISPEEKAAKKAASIAAAKAAKAEA
jgi:hypothetical protein